MATADKTINFVVSPPSSGPAWFASQGVKTWQAVASSGPNAVKMSPTPAGGTQSLSFMVWSSGIADPVRKSLLVWGGGHSDYSGNEIYELKLDVATPAWARITNASSPVSTSGPTHPDGQPNSFHTWGYCAYAKGKYWMLAAVAPYAIGGLSRGHFRFDRTQENLPAGAWTYLGDEPNSVVAGDSNGFRSGVSLFDSTSNKILTISPGGQSYTIDPDTLVKAQPAFIGPDGNFSMTAGINVAGRYAVAYFGSLGTIRVWDLDNLANVYTASFTGSPPHQWSGMQWHAASNAFLMWGGNTPRTSIYKLTPPATPRASGQTWTFSTVAANAGGATPDDIDRNGGDNNTHGRFNLIPNLGGTGVDALVLINTPSSPTYVYKLPAGGI